MAMRWEFHHEIWSEIIQVVFCGRNTEAGAKIAAENNAHFIQVDVTKHEQVESFFQKVSEISTNLSNSAQD